MPLPESAIAVVIEKLAEFDRTANQLNMPRAERLNILNVTDETYVNLRAGRVSHSHTITPEVLRRLSYALPLMRRLARADGLARSPASMGDMQLQAA